MKIGILIAGPVVERLEASHGNYGDMCTALLNQGGADFSVETFTVYENELPATPSSADGWLVTGSRYGAYEDHAWIAPLEAFLRDAMEAAIPVAGICFGHQILAQAMGGAVVKSEKGWGLGVQQYDLATCPSWMQNKIRHYTATAIHQDQVTRAPAGATVLASNEFCPIAALLYGNPERPQALTVQSHPEFSPAFTADLIAERRGNIFPEADSDAALQTLDIPLNNREWADWVARFYRAAQGG